MKNMKPKKHRKAISGPIPHDSSHFDRPDGTKTPPHDETAAILRRIAGHARQVKDCAELGAMCEAIRQPVTKKERAIIRGVVKTHARSMVEWAGKLPT